VANNFFLPSSILVDGNYVIISPKTFAFLFMCSGLSQQQGSNFFAW